VGIRERKIENHLRDRVEAAGGITRKWVSPSRDGVPDQIVIVPTTVAEKIRELQQLHPDTVIADYHLVEVKTTDGELEPSQVREHPRLIEKGCSVITVYGRSGADAFIETLIKK
jgi:hypothetical protein